MGTLITQLEIEQKKARHIWQQFPELHRLYPLEKVTQAPRIELLDENIVRNECTYMYCYDEGLEQEIYFSVSGILCYQVGRGMTSPQCGVGLRGWFNKLFLPRARHATIYDGLNDLSDQMLSGISAIIVTSKGKPTDVFKKPRGCSIAELFKKMRDEDNRKNAERVKKVLDILEN
jgi:hypothetical protein